MAGFRISDPAVQWTDDEGNLVPGGSLVFSNSGGSVPRNVYSDAAATISLGATLTIDASGRAPDFFMDGEYRVRLLDADDDEVWLRDNVRDVAGGGIVPLDPTSAAEGAFYRTDGTDAYWDEDVRELPDPTGSDGYFVVADGDGYILQAPVDDEALPTGGVTQPSSTVVTIGTQMFQRGTGTCPTSGSDKSTVAITFGTAFGAGTVNVQCTATVGVVTAGGANAFVNAVGASTTGFTAHAAAQTEHGSLATNISTAVTFDWFAWGTAP